MRNERVGHSRPPAHRASVLVALGLHTLLLAACGSGPDGGEQAPGAPDGFAAEAEVLEFLQTEASHHLLPEAVFDRLGWDLPDGGKQVRAIADAAPGGAFDPHALEALPATTLGYAPRWYEVRFQKYGLEWDVPALHLVPLMADPDLPTMVFINGGSANWYEFFVGPRNEPGLGQYLAQRVPVLLLTIPGNYRPGGWDETDPAARTPAYVLDRDISTDEARVRNSIYTFALVRDGVQTAIETLIPGPVVILGHSTSGEVQFMLKDALATRLLGRSLGWGTGGPASMVTMQRIRGAPSIDDYPPLSRLRARGPEEYAARYVGPLNPLWREGASALDVATEWLARESRRRPQFKQPLQDMEHQGAVHLRSGVERQIRGTLDGNAYGVVADSVAADLFSTVRIPITGYRRMIATTALNDTNNWNADTARARELLIARELREANPDATIRLLVFDVPMSHYGHIERPRQLAGGLVAALRWLVEEPRPLSAEPAPGPG
ncbi:MAG: hypothetical protein R3E10_14810 [Gemmatimonadota bacterium]